MAAIKRVDRITSTGKKFEHYSDFTSSFSVQPEQKDLVKLSNENCVKQCLRNIVQTTKGERPFNNVFGTNLKALLFEPMGSEVESRMEDMIRMAIENFEPRVKVQNITIIGHDDLNLYRATIVFSLINTDELQSLNIILTRAR